MSSQRQQLLAALIEVRDDTLPNGRMHCMGICWHVQARLGFPDWAQRRIQRAFRQLFLDDEYPVEGGAAAYYKDSREGTMWTNPIRLQLLDTLIDMFENQQEV